MHEYSIVTSLLDLCEENAKKEGSKKITKVEVKIGILSGVEPDLLQTAFDTFKEKTICDGAKFIMHIQDVVIHCNECNKEFTLKKNEFSCPECKSYNIETIDGEGMYLMRLEME
ncbi:MAG: hydrogenase maturation nickel metallochaperone HypA [Sulfurospirillum sp.]